MKQAQITLSTDTLDKLVVDQLKGWLRFYYEELSGTKELHPEDKKKHCKYAAAIETVLEMYAE